MIEFYGELSKECKNDRARKNDRLVAMLVLLTIIVLGVPYMVIEIMNGAIVRPVIIASILLAITILILLSHKFKIFPKPAQFVNLLKVTIDEQNISNTNVSGDNKKKTKSIQKVRKVIDCGDWYYIFFKFGDIGNVWVCQKNLLIKGTLEQFEKIFEGKIVKSPSKS